MFQFESLAEVPCRGGREYSCASGVVEVQGRVVLGGVGGDRVVPVR